MTIPFLESAADADNPLDPITPMRLAFFVRLALSSTARAVPGARGAVYTEVWARRAELAHRIDPALRAYRREEADVRIARSVCDVVAGLGGLIAGAASLVLFTTGGAAISSLVNHGTVSAGLETTGATAAALLIMAMVLRHAMRAREQRIGRRQARTYRQLIAGEVIEEINAMVGEIIHRDEERAHGALLHQMRAPSLVELGSPAVVRSESFNEVMALVSGHVTSAIGVAGPRGVGKTTLLRLLCDGASDRVGVYLPAPVPAAQEQLVRVIYGAVVRGVLLSRGVELSERGRTRVRRRFGRDIVWASQKLDEITGSTSRQWGRKAGLARWGVSAEASGQLTWTERELGPADWAERFRAYVRGHRVRDGAPIVVAIDELDKITESDQAIDVINGIKDLFHIEGVHFVASVSDDALRRFASRGIPMRDAFDTAFDTVIEVRRLRAEESYDLLRRRAPRFPYPAALFCHAWSGGLPRDLVRNARACVTIQNRGDAPVAVAELVQTVVRRDVREFLDAAIRRWADDGRQGRMEELLELRRLVEDDEAPPHRQLAGRTVPNAAGDDPLGASLAAFIEVAVAISEYYSAARDTEHWARGIESGEFLRHADYLAESKAALAVHPSEVTWRLTRARDRIGASATDGGGSGRAPARPA